MKKRKTNSNDKYKNTIKGILNQLNKIDNFEFEVDKNSFNRFISVTSEYFCKLKILITHIKKTGWKFNRLHATIDNYLKIYNKCLYIVHKQCICKIQLNKSNSHHLTIQFYNINCNNNFTYFNNSITAICRLVGYGFVCRPIMSIDLNELKNMYLNCIDCETVLLSYKENKIYYFNKFECDAIPL